MRSETFRVLVIILLVIIILLAAVAIFTPYLGKAQLGPMQGYNSEAVFGSPMNIGPMGRGMGMGMMRDVHAMADVESEFEYMIRMIPHHQEAVDSARILLERTERDEMAGFARDIISTQSREIEQMQTWLADWYPQRDTEAEYSPMMGNYSRLSGDRLDSAFLQDMIPHHMAAVMMSQQLLARVPVSHPPLEDLASSIRSTQMLEIQQMSLWLDQWFN